MCVSSLQIRSAGGLLIKSHKVLTQLYTRSRLRGRKTEQDFVSTTKNKPVRASSGINKRNPEVFTNVSLQRVRSQVRMSKGLPIMSG